MSPRLTEAPIPIQPPIGPEPSLPWPTRRAPAVGGAHVAD